MAEYIDTGDTVEGQKCEIYTRREDCKGLREDPITQKKMLVYELDRNSSVEVRESLILSEEEKILRDELNIHGEVGDKLKADAITVYVDVKRQLSVEKQLLHMEVASSQLKSELLGESNIHFRI